MSPVPQKPLGITFESTELQKADTIDGGVAWPIIDVTVPVPLLSLDVDASCLDRLVVNAIVSCVLSAIDESLILYF
jgi:hypothetical protein